MSEKIKRWASIATIIGTCIAAIALIPPFVQMFKPPETFQYVATPDSSIPVLPPSSSYSFPNVSNNPPVPFFNEWVNIDSQSKTIKRVSIQAKDGGAYINMIGSCSPTDCNFREEAPTVTVNYNYDSETEILHVEWVFDFQILTQELTITSDNQLRVKTLTHFIDNSGRVDFEMVDYFTRQ
ncbi:MAG: hypothetical protein IT247_00770 [Bacteroidia bacterium]|nr:hypothetical protein [Bacteroidia bacterium]